MATVSTGALLAGCFGESNGTDRETNEVLSGPNGDFVFEPETIEISTGDTVTWTFESTGHNVGAKPEDSDRVKLPSGADPFASYAGNKVYQTVEKGDTYEHTFETPGEYVYVCVPHVVSGMVGTVIVSD